MLIELQGLWQVAPPCVTEHPRIEWYMTVGIASMGLQVLPCQPAVSIQCDVGPRLLDGCTMATQEKLKGWFIDLSASTWMISAVSTKRISKSRTVVAFMFTSFINRQQKICGIAATVQATILVSSSNLLQFVLIMKLFDDVNWDDRHSYNFPWPEWPAGLEQ